MSSAVVIDAIRTPIARADARAGWFRDVRSDELSAGLISELVHRTGIDPALIEDVRWGCVQQQGEQGYDIARIAVGIEMGRPPDRLKGAIQPQPRIDAARKFLRRGNDRLKRGAHITIALGLAAGERAAIAAQKRQMRRELLS